MHSGRLGEQLLVAFGVEAVRLEGKPGARDRTDAFDKTRQLSKEIGVGHRKSSPPKYSTPPRPDLWASTQREPSFLNLSLSEERSTPAEGGVGRGATQAAATARIFSAARNQVAVLLTGGGFSVERLRLGESASVRCRALHLTRRHRCAAFADLSSDKERFGKALAPFLATSPFVSFSSQRDSHETHTQPQGLRLGARRMPESNPRRPTMLAPDSRYGIADPLQKDLFQRLEHHADRRKPDPWTSHTQRWRASRSRLAPRFAPTRRAMASNLRPSRCRAAPPHESSDKPGRSVS